MTEQVNLIPARLKSAVVGGYVAGAADIIDDVKGKTQNQINSDVDTKFGQHDNKFDEEDAKINSLEGGNFVTLEATDADTTIADVFTRLSITPATNVVYRIANWKHNDATTKYNVAYYSEYAANGNTTADLVPISVENKGIDDEPMAESVDFVKSGGVKKLVNLCVNGLMTSEILKSSLLLGEEETLTLTFENGYIQKDGTIRNSSIYKRTSITVEHDKLYIITIQSGGSSDWYGLTLKDSSDNILYNKQGGISGTFIIPQNCSTMLLSAPSSFDIIVKTQQVSNISVLLDLVDANTTKITDSNKEISDNLFFDGVGKTNNVVTPSFAEVAGTDNETEGYYDKEGVFHAATNYVSREYSVKKGCVYYIAINAYNKPTLVALDINSNVLFYFDTTIKKQLMFSDKVAKVLMSTYKGWGISFFEQYDHSDLNAGLKALLNFKTGNNVFDEANAKVGHMIKPNLYVSVPNNSFYNYKVGEIYNTIGATKMHITPSKGYSNCQYSAVDRYGNLIADQISVSSSEAIDITGAYRILIQVRVETDGTVMVNFGETALPYEPYYEYYEHTVSNAKVADVANTLSDTEFLSPVISNMGVQKHTVTANSLSNNNLILTTFPNYLKKNNTVLVDAKVTAFNEIVVGIGTGSGRGSQIRITNDKIYFQDGTKTSTTGSYTNVAHGLTITDFIKVMYKVSFGRVDYIVSTLGGYYKGYYEQADLYNENYGRPFVSTDANTTLTDVILGGTSDDFKCPVWVIGDSYVSLFTNRWTYYPIKEWSYKNWLLQGLAGGTSGGLYTDLLLSLTLGTPKYLVWCLGMNNADTDINTPNESWLSTVQNLIQLCEQKSITLILATIPNTADIINTAKNNWIKASGYRYIDFAKAVNGEVYTSGVDNWYAGYNDDGTHPTVLGAEALATQFLSDFPEVLQYK